MENSLIGWTHSTWNPWMGCHKVSPACEHCYIGQVIRRMGREPFDGPMKTTDATWKKPFTWNRKAKKAKRRHRVFLCSISDFFHRGTDLWRNDAWSVIRQCKHLDWLILTKRSERIAENLPHDWGDGWPHVWLGVTVENQTWTRRLDDLVRIPAHVRFVSAEPLLGPVDLRPWLNHLDWVITGCEQAAKAKRREMYLDWVRDLRDQCDKAEVPVFHKQYYKGTKLCYDGLIDGVKRQDWPA